jgi:hypothetical protein
MTDHELERQVRERLHAADLPSAPTELRRMITDLPGHPGRRRSGRSGGLVLLAAAMMAVVGLGLGGVLMSGRPPEVDSTVAPTASALDVIPSDTSLPAGFVPFRAPGIAFAHPDDWVPSTAFDNLPSTPGWRYVAAFARGMTLCPPNSGGSDATEPPGCVRSASKPGTLEVQVVEMLRQLPGTIDLSGGSTTFAGYRASEPTHEIGDTDPIALSWFVAGPDDSLYMFWGQAPNAEIEALRNQMEATLPTLQLSSWQEPPEVVDGLVHVDTGQGFSFDYPAGWTVYYPNELASGSHSVMTIASQPLEPPCAEDSCQGFTTPPGTAVIQFRIGSRPGEPDWANAHTTIGGQPAFVTHWDRTGTEVDEGDQMNVRLDGEGHTLSILASHRGPGVEEQRELVGQVIDTIEIDAPPP